jgi:glutathione S-transferase
MASRAELSRAVSANLRGEKIETARATEARDRARPLRRDVRREKIQDKPRKLGVGDVTMLLYDSPVSGNCYKVRLLLAHLDIPYDRRTVDVVDRSDRPAILGGLNPALRVPTLVLSDGRPLAESNAILWYFGESTQFVPEERYERAKVLQWMFFEQYEHEPALAVVRFWVAYSGRPEAFADRLDERRAAGHRALDAMQRHLEKNPFLAAGAFSIADIALYAYTHVAHEGGFDLESYPAITKWLERVAAQPGHITIDA